MAKRSFHVVALVVIALLVGLFGSGASHAAPGERDGDGRRNSQRLAPGVLQDSRNQGAIRQDQSSQYNDAQDNARRQANRMSPEDRRNLRRQINEAGQDIYVPRR